MQPVPPPGDRPSGGGRGSNGGLASSLSRGSAPKTRADQVNYLITTGVVGEIDKAIELLLANVPKNPMRFLAEHFTQRAELIDSEARRMKPRRASKNATGSESLFTRLGGAWAVDPVVDTFYSRITSDPALSAVFAHVDMQRLKAHQKAFVTFALGGPNDYTGRNMKEAHAALNVTEEMFDRVVGHFNDALRSHAAVNEADVNEVLAVVDSVRGDVVAPGASVALYKKMGPACIAAAAQHMLNAATCDPLTRQCFDGRPVRRIEQNFVAFCGYALGADGASSPGPANGTLEKAHLNAILEFFAEGLVRNGIDAPMAQRARAALEEHNVAQVLGAVDSSACTVYEQLSQAALDRVSAAFHLEAMRTDDLSGALRNLSTDAQMNELAAFLIYTLEGPVDAGADLLRGVGGALSSVQFEQLTAALRSALKGSDVNAMDHPRVLERALGSKGTVLKVTKTLYDKLGGENGLQEAVRIFYEKLVADAAIRPFFRDVDIVAQRKKQRLFLTFVFGGSAGYSGKNMRDAHRRLVKDMGLNETHFDAVVGHLGATLKELGVPDADIAEAAGIATSVKDDVLCKGEDFGKKPLFERIGGAAAVDAAVEKFYTRLMGDAQIAPFFRDVDIAAQGKKQRLFLTFVFGGSAGYSGKNMRDAHRRLVKDMGLNETHFDAVVGHLGATLKELGVPDADIAEAAGIATSVKDDVLCKGEDFGKKPLFERIGGAAAVDAAVEKFYTRLMGDAQIAPFFKGVDMAGQKRMQKAFLTFAFGGAKEFGGKKMADAHRRLVLTMGLNDSHFDAVLNHLGATLAELDVPAEEMREATTIAESVRDAVLCKGEASLFERIGGEAAVDAAVTKFYDKIFADDLVNPFFLRVDAVTIRRKQKAFLTYVFGGKAKYTGKALDDAHRRFVEDGLSDKHFDCVAQHLLDTLNELNVPPQERDDVMNIVSCARDDVLCRTPAPKRSLMERIGGKDVLEAVSIKFFDKVFSNASLTTFMQSVDKERQRKKVKLFLHFALGGGGEYDGITMEEAHRPLVDRGMNDSHVDTFVGLLRESLIEERVGDDEVKEVCQQINTVRDAVLCRSAKKRSLYERVGGENAVAAAVEKLYEKITNDETLDCFFDMVDMDKLKRSQKAFLTFALGGTEQMTGHNLAAAHKRAVNKGLNDAHYDSVVKHLSASLQELGVGQQEISEAEAVAESVRAPILGRLKRNKSLSSMKKTGTLFERLGGKEVLGNVVDDFYDRIYQDPLLKNFFGNTDMDRLRDKQVEFLMFAFGAGTKYTGESLEKAHRSLVRERQLDDSHFDSVLSHLLDSLKELGAQDIELADVKRTVEEVRVHVLGKNATGDDAPKKKKEKPVEAEKKPKEALPPPSPTAAASLWEQLGDDMANNVVRTLNEMLAKNEHTKKFFANVDMHALAGHQKSLLKVVFGGADEYVGKDLNLAHKRLVADGLNDVAFDAFLECVRDAMRECGATGQQQIRASRELGAHRDAVLGQARYPTALFHKIGGAAAVETVVKLFYEKVINDVGLKRFFNEANMENLRQHQARFIGEALGSPVKYSGKAMSRAHSHLVLTQGLNMLHTLRVVKHLETTLDDAGLAEDDIKTIMATVKQVNDQIIPSSAKAEARDLPLFKRVGGDHLLDTLIPEFIDRVSNDQRIRAFFVGVEKRKLGKSVKEFLMYIMESGTPYTGKSMRSAHKHLIGQGLNDLHVESFFEIFNATMRDFLIADNERELLHEKMRSYKSQVLGRNDASEASGGMDDMGSADDEESALFTGLGGRTSIHGIAASVLDSLAADDVTKRFFKGVDLDKLATTLASYLGSEWGGSEVYPGKALRPAHAHLVQDGLNDSHFDRFIEVLREVLEKKGLDDDIVEEAITIVSDEQRADVLNNAD
eukprot:TRINITY_DN499_c0_g3_i1.p1 TRINITY_DN499_c0_g3~~TRINITY_DN499_c0_g3_i1.p1  ORF type:complete len:1908 (+),score=628.88 TRINITY_DN499_c0_g3_i1:77-5725(+)